jgi:6-phosphogluconolactonase (cycloisomerase 2 family)
MLLAVGTAGAASKHHSSGSVYTLTNSTAGNTVAVFERAKDGTLTPNGTYPTGGTGTGANLGSQGAVILSENGHHLFAVNAGSNSISQFRITHDGLDWQATVPSGGASPISLTLHGRVLYVLNAGGAGNISGFVVKRNGLTPLAGSTRPEREAPVRRRCRSRPTARRSWSPRRHRARSTPMGRPPRRRRAADRQRAVGGTPFGFDFDKRGNV